MSARRSSTPIPLLAAMFVAARGFISVRMFAVQLSVFMLGLLLGAAPSIASPGGAAPAFQDAPPLLDEVTVNGERTGPGMWRVHRGDATVWILGSMSPLPKGITWRSKQLEQVLDGTNQVVVQKPFEIGIARVLWLLLTERDVLMVRGGKRLKDVMPPDLYTRFSVQRAKFTNDSGKWERFRPSIAALFLQHEAFHQVGLSARLDLGAAVRKLAKEHRVRLEELKIAGVGDVMDALKTMQPATENACVEASLVTVEKDLPRLIDRAQAWATGNVERIESLHEPAEVDACRAAVENGQSKTDLIALVRQTWLTRIVKYLQSSGVTVAVVNMDLLLEKGGILDQLRARGYDVDGP